MIFLYEEVEVYRDRMDGMTDLCDRKFKEEKTNWMLWLDVNKILKILTGDEKV